MTFIVANCNNKKKYTQYLNSVSNVLCYSKSGSKDVHLNRANVCFNNREFVIMKYSS